MKHTAGQWQVFVEVKVHPLTKVAGTQYVIRTIGGRGSNWRVIARTPRHTGEKMAAENEANARLWPPRRNCWPRARGLPTIWHTKHQSSLQMKAYTANG